jgi:hypothetical protein
MNIRKIQDEFKTNLKEIEKICDDSIDKLDNVLESNENIDDAKRQIQDMCKNGMLEQLEIILRKQGKNFHNLADETANLNKTILDWKPKQ